MPLKKHSVLLFTISVCLITFILDKLQWNVIAVINARYNSLVSGLFYDLIFLIRAALICAGTVLGICHIWKSRKGDDYKKVLAWIPLAAVAFTVLFQYILPLTETGVYLDYIANKAYRAEIVDMVYSNKIDQYMVGENQYYIPNQLFKNHSYNAKIYTSGDAENVKVLFYVHIGLFKDTALIYASGEQAVKDGDFGFDFDSISNIDEHWYSVSIADRVPKVGKKPTQLL